MIAMVVSNLGHQRLLQRRIQARPELPGCSTARSSIESMGLRAAWAPSSGSQSDVSSIKSVKHDLMRPLALNFGERSPSRDCF